MALLYALHIESNRWNRAVGGKIMVSQICSSVARYGGGFRKTPHQVKGCIAGGRDILEGEFSALLSKRYQLLRNDGIWGSDGTLTANTLNNEVLPAFCKPIIVISISVALSIKDKASA